MPLVYPDFNLSGILYLTRIRTEFFYDYTRGTGNYIFVSDINSLGKRVVTTENHDYSETFKSFGSRADDGFLYFPDPVYDISRS